MRKRKKDELRKLRGRDDKKRGFRRGIKMADNDIDLVSIKNPNGKDKKNQKFTYDDQGRKVHINITEKYHPPEDGLIS